MPEKIVLVAGSRTWVDTRTVHDALRKQEDEGCDMVLVHGACETGADDIAHKWAMQRGWEIRAFPAQWNSFGRRAGPMRNRHMVTESRPHIALVFFWQPLSRGTQDCLRCLKVHQKSAHSRLENILIFQRSA